MSEKDELLDICAVFLEEVKEMTAGTDVERWLNETKGPGSEFYDTAARLVIDGVRKGWAANIEVDGPRYRRSRLSGPTEQTCHFSVTAVYMDSMADGNTDRELAYRGEYHLHPYGELNMVIPLDDGAQLAGPNGWCGKGWTAPPPGSHHYPEVKGGSVIALFFLPAGRISYNISPN